MVARTSKVSLPCSLPRGWTASHTLPLPKAPTWRQHLHKLVHVVNDQTTSSFEFFTQSLRPRESTASIAAVQVTSQSSRHNADFQYLHAFVSIGHCPRSFHDKGKEKLETIVARTDTAGCYATRSGCCVGHVPMRPASNPLGLASTWTTATSPTYSSTSVWGTSICAPADLGSIWKYPRSVKSTPLRLRITSSTLLKMYIE